MYKILDLFAGAGGLSLGFEMTGQFEVVAIVENNKNAAKSYIENHPGLTNYDDIIKVDFNRILKDKGDIDVVIGGPPCQGFSNANRQRRQLINGSNELVKRYVKAIEVIKPKAFVMENVKTIASDKQSFCLTYSDNDYIRNELQIQIHDKDVVLYEGSHIKEINDLCENHVAKDLVLLSEEELYIVYNIYKKKNKLKEYYEKPANVKKIENIIEHMGNKVGLPDWYNDSTLNAKNVLQDMIDKSGVVDISKIDILKNFWDIQRFFQGILELDSKNAMYDRIATNRSITVRMQTYIVIDFIRSAFKYLGYQINGKTLNASSFGVPQNRERFILIGIKNENHHKEIRLPENLIDNPEEFVTVEQAIYDLEKYIPTTQNMDAIQEQYIGPEINTYYRKLVINNDKNEIYNHVCTETTEAALERFKVIQQGKNFHSLPEKLKKSYENPDRTQNTIYKRLVYKQPSDTVVNVRKSMWIHPELNRAISAREAARLQSFPDNYKFLGTKDSVYQQIGNAVPPLLGRAVAESVLDLIGCEQEVETLKSIYDKYKNV